MNNNCQIDIPVASDPAEDFDPLIYLSQMSRLLSYMMVCG